MYIANPIECAKFMLFGTPNNGVFRFLMSPHRLVHACTSQRCRAGGSRYVVLLDPIIYLSHELFFMHHGFLKPFFTSQCTAAVQQYEGPWKHSSSVCVKPQRTYIRGMREATGGRRSAAGNSGFICIYIFHNI